jgi:endo-beta-N-acetylglucosaminidase D
VSGCFLRKKKKEKKQKKKKEKKKKSKKKKKPTKNYVNRENFLFWSTPSRKTKNIFV